jgi:hypothetical protein
MLAVTGDQEAATVFREAQRLAARASQQWDYLVGAGGRLLDVLDAPAVWMRSGTSLDWKGLIRARKHFYLGMEGLPQTTATALAVLTYTPAIQAGRELFEETGKPHPLIVVLEEAGALGLSGSSGKSSDTGDGRDPRPPARPVSSPATPEERMAVPVPVGGRLRDGAADFLPRREPPPLQRQALEHLPPRLDQVEVGGVLRLEDELPPRVRQAKQQHVGGPVRLQVVDDGVHPLGLGRDPRLGPLQEVGPVGGAAARVGMRQGFPGGRAEGAEDISFAAAAVVDLLLGSTGGAALTVGPVPRRGDDGLLAGDALGCLRPHLVKADDDRTRGRLRVEALDRPLFAAKSGSTRSPNQVSW